MFLLLRIDKLGMGTEATPLLRFKRDAASVSFEQCPSPSFIIYLEAIGWSRKATIHCYHTWLLITIEATSSSRSINCNFIFLVGRGCPNYLLKLFELWLSLFLTIQRTWKYELTYLINHQGGKKKVQRWTVYWFQKK